MSILIKGMEMPTNCFLCPLSVLNENRLFCKVTKNEVLRAKIDADCPLVPVPPHGRLIDADALVRELNSILVSFGSANGLVEGGLNIAISTVNGMPTIIPASEEGE